MESYDLALLILRVCIGLTLVGHGYQKFFSGGRIAGTAKWFESIGMRPGVLHARLAATAEVGAGLALAAGLLTPIAGAVVIALMFVAAWTVHRHNGFYIVKDGWEYNAVLGVTALAVATLGAGQYSLDHVLGVEWMAGWPGATIALALGLVGGIGQLLVFYREPAPTECEKQQ